jgi:hypothetical protein
MNRLLREIGRLSRQAHCKIDLRPDGRIVLKRGPVALTNAMQPSAALAWLNSEAHRWAEGRAKAKAIRAQHRI